MSDFPERLVDSPASSATLANQQRMNIAADPMPALDQPETDTDCRSVVAIDIYVNQCGQTLKLLKINNVGVLPLSCRFQSLRSGIVVPS